MKNTVTYINYRGKQFYSVGPTGAFDKLLTRNVLSKLVALNIKTLTEKASL
jgi:hypothetical protein